LLTTGNPEANKDMQLFAKLGINTETVATDDIETEQKITTAVVNQQNKELFYDAAL
jgi:biotin synthase